MILWIHHMHFIVITVVVTTHNYIYNILWCGECIFSRNKFIQTISNKYRHQVQHKYQGCNNFPINISNPFLWLLHVYTIMLQHKGIDIPADKQHLSEHFKRNLWHTLHVFKMHAASCSMNIHHRNIFSILMAILVIMATALQGPVYFHLLKMPSEQLETNLCYQIQCMDLECSLSPMIMNIHIHISFPLLWLLLLSWP